MGPVAPSPPARPRLAALLPWLVLAASAAALAWHASRHLPFISDDALISLRYADRLVDGKGLTWTDGERVEGYSNLLWILATAALHRLGVDLILAARVLGLAGMTAALGALVWVHRPGARSPAAGVPASILPALVGTLALAACGPMAVWTIGGLEQPLVAALLAWAAALSLARVERERPAEVLAPAIPLALLCITRPDGALFTAAFALALVLARGPSRASLAVGLRLSALPAAVFLAQVAFRIVYYGDFVANSARVKLAFTSTRLLGGLHYIGAGFWWLSGLTLLAACALLAARDLDRRRRIVLLATPLLAWSAYVCVIGGDIFPARRHVVPIAVLLAFLAAEGLAFAAARGRRVRAAAWVISLACVALLSLRQQRDPENGRARIERWEWAGASIGVTLARAFGAAQPLLAVDPAGCVPYFSGLPALDMLGLNDRWLATHPPPDAGHGALAHEFGDGAYVYSRAPDLVLLCNPWGHPRGCFRGGKELVALPAFRADYQLVKFEAAWPFPFHSQIFVRKESEKIGIRRDAGAIEVPGYLLAGTPGSVAVFLADERRLAARVGPEAPGKLRFDLPPGTWRIDLDARGADAALEVRDGLKVVARGRAPLEFTASAPTTQVTVVPGREALLRGLRLSPAAPPTAAATPDR